MMLLLLLATIVALLSSKKWPCGTIKDEQMMIKLAKILNEKKTVVMAMKIA